MHSKGQRHERIHIPGVTREIVNTQVRALSTTHDPRRYQEIFRECFERLLEQKRITIQGGCALPMWDNLTALTPR